MCCISLFNHLKVYGLKGALSIQKGRRKKYCW